MSVWRSWGGLALVALAVAGCGDAGAEASEGASFVRVINVELHRQGTSIDSESQGCFRA